MNLPDSAPDDAAYPRSQAYNPEWLRANGFGSNPLVIAEWLSRATRLAPGMRVLDLGCGRATSSIFLAREFGVQVWATDLWVSARSNLARIREARVADRVFPIHADARNLPFAPEFFDAVLCHDSFMYFGTDALYLNYLASFVPPGGLLGFAQAGLVREIGPEGVPEHLKTWWTQDLWGLHTADWWRSLWERTGIVAIETADTMPDGNRRWLDWHRFLFPDGSDEIRAIEADAGRTIGYVRVVARRRAEAKLEEYAWPKTLAAMIDEHATQSLLRSDAPRQIDAP
ncbi:MAG: class I SAM-dependent methyltransferase [Isosphaeraceae bacterium]|nr:class I SAM-dependent methyltransferase [Isosphaeraceae bacterium]